MNTTTLQIADADRYLGREISNAPAFIAPAFMLAREFTQNAIESAKPDAKCRIDWMPIDVAGIQILTPQESNVGMADTESIGRETYSTQEEQ